MKLLTDYLPNKINKVLFGDRLQYGFKVNEDDADWVQWLSVYSDFYSNTQKKGIGKYVNDAGYRIFKNFNFQDKVVLEIGPGSLPHLEFMKGKPSKYIIADIDQEFLSVSKKKLDDFKIKSESILIDNRENPNIPNIQVNSIDVIVTFYSLEHLYPLEPFLNAYKQYLKKDGVIIGAVPCEGGLAWGLGRFLTSRRWLKKNTSINPDKIICWEHPNFISRIKNLLDKNFQLVNSTFFPFRIISGDLNLVFSFVYKKTT